MPMRSASQRRLMYAASEKAGGAGGVSQAVAKEFVSADAGGKLPEKAAGAAAHHARDRYSKKTVTR